MQRERLLSVPPDVTLASPLKRVRSTLLASSILSLRQLGYFDAYSRKLSQERRADIASLVAGVWVPAAFAHDHYAACEAIGLSSDAASAMGASVGNHLQASVVSTLTRLATGAGATPWAGFGVYDRLWARLFDGGGFAIDRVGPKDALVTVRLPFARYRYFRSSYGGVQIALVELFATKAYCREVSGDVTPEGFSLRLSWA